MIRAALCLAMVIAVAADAAAQARGGDSKTSQQTKKPPREIFGRLFAANRECRDCENRPGETHFVMDSPRLTQAWLSRHEYQSNGSTYGDNVAVADFWYDAVHRRFFSRSLVLHEVGDPADMRLGRAPGEYPNEPDFTRLLQPGTTVGHVGFVGWNSNGFGAYFAAVQGAVADISTGYLDLSTITGMAGTTRTGSKYAGDDLIKHVRLHPSGQLEIGFETDPEARPDPLLLVRGNVQIEGTLVVAGSSIGEQQPATAPLSCSVRSATGRGRAAAAACDAGQAATGGGGTCGAGDLRGSRPLSPGDTPTGWEITCSRDGAHAVHVVCCVR